MSEQIEGFPPLVRPDARRLILGSMPSVASLQAGAYYAHPRNAFWPILMRLLGGDAAWPYRQRCGWLIRHYIALWDVLHACQRTGSLDAAIDEATIVPNDFATFLAHHRDIGAIYFNGAKAEQAYRRHVLPGLPDRLRALPMQRLPSTSPAHAAMTLEQKLAEWQAALMCTPPE